MRADMFARHLCERTACREMQARKTGDRRPRGLQKQPKGFMAFLTRITGIRAIIEFRQNRQDERRADQHKDQPDALLRRHDREVKETDRHYRRARPAGSPREPGGGDRRIARGLPQVARCAPLS